MKKILVTGGNGFIGTNFIIRAIKKYGFDVVNVDKMTYASNTTVDEFFKDTNKYSKRVMDICDLDMIHLNGVDAVINIAAESHVDNSIDGPMVFERSNVYGTLNLLECCRQYNSVNKTSIRFLQVSTDEVYGSLDLDEPAFTEQHQIQPNSPYSASKAGADAFVRAYHETYGLDTVTTRCSNNYGPYQHNEKFVPKIVENVIMGIPIPIYGDGKQIRDWVYVGDHCEAIMTVLLKGKSGEVYNVGGDCEKENISIVEAILTDMNRDMTPVSEGGLISYVTDRLGHDKRYGMNHDKLTSELGWKPEMSFEDGIKYTIDAVRDNARKNGIKLK